MSLILTAWVREGIVMTADSRLTLDNTQTNGPQVNVRLSLSQSDSTYKLFLCQNRIGISTCGAADISGVPITGYIDSFISGSVTSNVLVENVGPLLLAHFRTFSPIPNVHFHVAGYQNGEQRFYNINVASNSCERIDQLYPQGVQWGGDTEIISRLIKSVNILDGQNNIIQSFGEAQIPYNFFTLQDAIDFCVSLTKTTIDAIRFQIRPKTVGGPIDVLVLKQNEFFWVQRKELHA